MAKSIMIQGTASNSGKSLMAAGLCRVLAQDGWRIAPFKSQNMALNSFVTKDGLEMGRAQVMQAECAGVEPDVRMNPILLKPTGESGSQVILNGEVLGELHARDYYARKESLAGPVLEAYRSLAEEYDIIVLEGAGSPAEINLKENDIVNMGMARMAGAPVLLVGDIDRGGVFASLAGTHLLFEQWERALLKGVIINKFRGDVGLLRPGLQMLENIINKPVLGVVPYLQIDVDDEDSLSGRLQNRTATGVVDIAVIRLPHLSNFTDFNVFATLPGVSVRYVERPGELGRPDLLILPGTKHTMGDMQWLRKSRLEEAVKSYADTGGAIFGICGGYQMLGMELSDPEGAEGGGELAGMGLLPCRTRFSPQKNRRQVSGSFQRLDGALTALSGISLTGYEIHMGLTERMSGEPLCALVDERGEVWEDGAAKGNVYGSYVHGVFDEPAVVEAVVRSLAQAKGIDWDSFRAVDYQAYKNEQYDKLADALRESLDMAAIYRIIEEGGEQEQ